MNEKYLWNLESLLILIKLKYTLIIEFSKRNSDIVFIEKYIYPFMYEFLNHDFTSDKTSSEYQEKNASSN